MEEPKDRKVDKAGRIMKACADLSKIEDEEFLGNKFDELMGFSDELLDLIHNLINRKNEQN